MKIEDCSKKNWGGCDCVNECKGLYKESNSDQGNNRGLRFNKGKTRHDLVPAFAQDEYAKVLTKGAEKYADRNWEKGMQWSKVIASLERHLNAFKKGIDRDEETGLLHTAHIMCNAAFLTEYYKIYPQGDDRPHAYLKKPLKIGLDIDEVLADFIGGLRNLPSVDAIEDPNYWNDYFVSELLMKVDDDFWINLKPKISPKSLPFEPHCYITSRSISSTLTTYWLQLHGFPEAPVYSVGVGASKVEAAKESGIDIFVDDCYDNFVELNRAGICTYLYDAPHNRRFDVGYKRITNLSEIPV